jgi:uncharacterized protein (TIGR03435 family)
MERSALFVVALSVLAVSEMAGDVLPLRLTIDYVRQGVSARTFDVASVRPNHSGEARLSFGGPAGRYEIVNAPLRTIVRVAHQVQDYQIVEAPGWIATERFDILATTSAVMPAERAEMLRNLLADRFSLRTHIERRDMPIFEMVLIRSDGRLGRSARATDVNCAERAAGLGGGVSPSVPPVGAGPDRPPCGLMQRPGVLMAGAMTMGEFARALAPQVNRFVLDRTGITGPFDLDVQFTPDETTPVPPGASPLPVDPAGPSLFTALQEQLGIRLNATRGSVEVLVIDAISRPTSD